jgi:5-methylcytosine-specific restriction endonuclease McrA
MSRAYINLEIRRLVVERAGKICEYCLISEEDTTSCQVDHIISVKHGGASTDDNLCYACVFCNLQKGTDLGSINWRNGEADSDARKPNIYTFCVGFCSSIKH